MAVPLLTINSLLPSQSLFNEIQSVHETGFFHELDSYLCCKDGFSATAPATQVNILDPAPKIIPLPGKGAIVRERGRILTCAHAEDLH